jgi:hypothetical protein
MFGMLALSYKIYREVLGRETVVICSNIHVLSHQSHGGNEANHGNDYRIFSRLKFEGGGFRR